MSLVKKVWIPFVALSIFVATTPVLAEEYGMPHDHAMQQTTPDNDSSAKDAEKILNGCAQQVGSIQRHINRLRAEMEAKHKVGPIVDELKSLEQRLKEANEIVRPLHVY